MPYRLIDYETTSFANLPQVGSLMYAKDISTRVLCVAVAKDGESPVVLPEVGPTADTLVSWSRFDYYIYNHVEGFPYPSRKWVDLQAVARYVGLPGGLDAAADMLGLRVRKDPRGKRLIKLYSADPTRSMPEDDRKALYEYAQQDVVVLQEIWNHLKGLVPEWERHCRASYETTQRMNERGVPIDVRAVRAALFQCETHEKDLTDELRMICGLNPSQNLELAKYLGVDSVAKDVLEGRRFSNPAHQRVAEIRLEFAKAATKKLKPMLSMARTTGRAHGCFVFNGAHTGRGSSQDIQFQNLARGKVSEDVFSRLYAATRLPNPLQNVRDNIRGMIYSPGNKIIVADYAQVEARLVAWMADEPKMLDAFVNDRDIYKEFASAVFKVPVGEVTDQQRMYGKIIVLGAGYGAGGKKLAEQAKGYGVSMSVSEGEDLKRKYRTLFARVPAMWDDLTDAVTGVILGRYPKAHVARCAIAMLSDRRILGVRLPSGRILRYLSPEVDETGEISYLSRYGRRRIWGGHFTENFAQAIATDLKLAAMNRLDEIGLNLILEVHDEIVVESPASVADKDLAIMVHTMEDTPAWMLPNLIRAEGKILNRYSK